MDKKLETIVIIGDLGTGPLRSPVLPKYEQAREARQDCYASADPAQRKPSDHNGVPVGRAEERLLIWNKVAQCRAGLAAQRHISISRDQCCQWWIASHPW